MGRELCAWRTEGFEHLSHSCHGRVVCYFIPPPKDSLLSLSSRALDTSISTEWATWRGAQSQDGCHWLWRGRRGVRELVIKGGGTCSVDREEILGGGGEETRQLRANCTHSKTILHPFVITLARRGVGGGWGHRMEAIECACPCPGAVQRAASLEFSAKAKEHYFQVTIISTIFLHTLVTVDDRADRKMDWQFISLTLLLSNRKWNGCHAYGVSAVCEVHRDPVGLHWCRSSSPRVLMVGTTQEGIKEMCMSLMMVYAVNCYFDGLWWKSANDDDDDDDDNTTNNNPFILFCSFPYTPHKVS